MQTTTKRKRREASPEAKAKRSELIAQSCRARIALKTGILPAEFADCGKINDVLRRQYELATGHGPESWETFLGWKERGRSVNKGERAFFIWGAPKRFTKAEETHGEEQAEGAEKSFRAFPLCYLFHIGQTSAIESE